jgi:hypothetical protein
VREGDRRGGQGKGGRGGKGGRKGKGCLCPPDFETWRCLCWEPTWARRLLIWVPSLSSKSPDWQRSMQKANMSISLRELNAVAVIWTRMMVIVSRTFILWCSAVKSISSSCLNAFWR